MSISSAAAYRCGFNSFFPTGHFALAKFPAQMQHIHAFQASSPKTRPASCRPFLLGCSGCDNPARHDPAGSLCRSCGCSLGPGCQFIPPFGRVQVSMANIGKVGRRCREPFGVCSRPIELCFIRHDSPPFSSAGILSPDRPRAKRRRYAACPLGRAAVAPRPADGG